MSAKKALRQSKRKRAHNLFWKRRVKSVAKEISDLLGNKGSELGILKEKESLLQKYADKAAKVNVIHKNKANRLKSKYARKISAYFENSSTSKKKSAKTSAKNAKK